MSGATALPPAWIAKGSTKPSIGFLLPLGRPGFLPELCLAANGGKVHLSVVERRVDLVCS
jgi:hypothetical protein